MYDSLERIGVTEEEFKDWCEQVTTGFENANAFSSPIYFKKNAKLNNIQLPDDITYEQHIQRDVEVKRVLMEQNTKLQQQQDDLRQEVISLKCNLNETNNKLDETNNKLDVLLQHLVYNKVTGVESQLKVSTEVSLTIRYNWLSIASFQLNCS